MLAPYSEIARSKLASGSGTCSALPWISGKSIPNRSWNASGVGELRLGVVDPDRPGAAAGQPGRDVAGSAAELDRVLALELGGEHADARLREPPRFPRSAPRCSSCVRPGPSKSVGPCRPTRRGCAGRAREVRSSPADHRRIGKNRLPMAPARWNRSPSIRPTRRSVRFADSPRAGPAPGCSRGSPIASTARSTERTDGRHTVASLIAGLPILMLTTTGAKSGKRADGPGASACRRRRGSP